MGLQHGSNAAVHLSAFILTGNTTAITIARTDQTKEPMVWITTKSRVDATTKIKVKQVKQVKQIEVCHLLGKLHCSERSEVQEALLACLLQCVDDITAADVGVAAVQSLPAITSGSCADDVGQAFAQVLQPLDTRWPSAGRGLGAASLLLLPSRRRPQG